MSELIELEPFRDSAGRLKAWPRKRRLQRTALSLIVEAFDVGRAYSQMEVGEVLAREHSFGDPAILRRGLIEWGLMERTTDGSRYWRTGADRS
jgi:hypothetical protein